eukprot:gb/GECH01003877.1/.p1 GENE.gb/GECH01003877.1/~~gb/GECH01003877.1/.p1  ORF type:complete len:631 (+),score=131.29 gb/GECH01003877.1/:1-1893(+)
MGGNYCDNILAQLRVRAQHALKNRQFVNAIFLADKAVTLSEKNIDDIHLLAEACLGNGEAKRALHLLGEFITDECESYIQLRTRYLATKCAHVCNDWEQMLDLLGSEDEQFEMLIANTHLDSPPPPTTTTTENNTTPETTTFSELRSCVCLLRAKAYNMQDNVRKAVVWYRRALELDPFCYEAFENLVENHLLSLEEEQEVLANVPFGEDLEWLRLLYAARIEDRYPNEMIHNNSIGNHPSSSLSSSSLKHDAKGSNTTRDVEKENTAIIGSSACRVLMSDYQLSQNPYVCSASAEHSLQAQDFETAFKLTHGILTANPYDHSAMNVYLASLVELKNTSELFKTAHSLVEACPDTALAWYAVGCYYLACQRYDAAHRYFVRSTQRTDRRFLPAWLGVGHALAAEGETDQALAAYRTACRMFPGSHLPLLCLGMQYAKTGALSLAEQSLQQALKLCPQDAALCNELGAVLFRLGCFSDARHNFEEARRLCGGDDLNDIWQTATVNLGHTSRKLCDFPRSVAYLEEGLAYAPQDHSVHAALGFAQHLSGDIDAAIESYHRALSLRPADSFVTEMLTRALQDMEHDGGLTGEDDEATSKSSNHTDMSLHTSGSDIMMDTMDETFSPVSRNNFG